MLKRLSVDTQKNFSRCAKKSSSLLLWFGQSCVELMRYPSQVFAYICEVRVSIKTLTKEKEKDFISEVFLVAGSRFERLTSGLWGWNLISLPLTSRLVLFTKIEYDGSDEPRKLQLLFSMIWPTNPTFSMYFPTIANFDIQFSLVIWKTKAE